MNSRVNLVVWLSRAGIRCRYRWLVWLCIACAGASLSAKEPVLTAIELYDSASGAAYIQITDVLINGKAEMRACAPCATAPLEKDAYGKLPKITLGPGGVLERGQDGILRYASGDGPAVIVVPVNAKFDKKSALSAAELADQAGLKSVPAVAAPGAEAPQIIRGVTLVFVAAPDQEFAEYLRAKRANDIPGWKNYLTNYATSTHAGDAHVRLAKLFVEAGEASLAAYGKTAGADSPSYKDLKAAKASADEARALSSSLPELTKLDAEIVDEVSGIADKGRTDLDAYRAALKAHGTGYVHLAAARNYADISEGIVSTSKGQSLESDVMHDVNSVQNALRQAESSTTARQFDEAMTAIATYRSFADEEPRIAAVVNAAYGYHLDRGKKAAAIPDWPTAITEFTKAASDKDTSECHDLLANSREQWAIALDIQAAATATDQSKQYEAAKDILQAYEVLDNLPPGQRKLVTDDIERLQPAYVQRAQQYANELHKASAALKGPGDQAQIERAYDYLDRAYKISQDDSYRDRMGVLADELSNYLLKQADDNLAKANGSGTEIAYAYLEKAVQYKATNIGDVRNAMQQYTQQHAIRSKLSILVQFRDQTSQADSGGFAGRLENAVITGLENSKVQVKVIRASELTPVGADPSKVVNPDYQLDGNVLRHHTTNVMTPQSVESKYLVTTERIPNDEWNKINREYEKAQTELKTAQDALEGAEAKGNKGQEKDWKAQVEAGEKKVEDAHARLDATPQTVPHDIIRGYSYTRKTFALTSSIQLRYAIVDTVSGERTETVPIAKEDHASYDELDGVSPADTTGPKQLSASIDEGEFSATTENSVIESLVDSVRKQVEALPPKIYKQARQLEDSEDMDGAGEGYLHYIEISPRDDASADQRHAREFLLQNFNLRPVAAVAQ